MTHARGFEITKSEQISWRRERHEQKEDESIVLSSFFFMSLFDTFVVIINI